MIQRLRRIILLVRSLMHAIFYGKADKILKDPSVIIVVLTGKLGDIVCGTPVLRALRAHLPDTRLIVAGTVKLLRPLLSDSGLVDDYLDLEAPGALARIKKCHAQAALVTGPSFTSAALLYLSGVPLVVAPKVEGGFSPSETKPYKILQKLIKTFPYQIGEYAPRERLRALEPLGIFTSDTKKHLGFSTNADRRVEQFFVDNSIDVRKDFVVGITPTAGNKIKEWPEERFAEVADYLAQKYKAQIIIIGGPGDKEKVRRTADFMKFAKPLQVTSLNIDELKALVFKLSLFISVDTGPIYIAEAFGIPTIDIVGPMDEKGQPPHGLIHRNVVPPGRERPELSVLNARLYNKEEARRQVLSTTAPAVFKEIDGLIDNLRRYENRR